jgi:hypothetical protein
VVGAEEEEWRQKVRLQSHCLAKLLCSRICFLQSRESQDVLLLHTWFFSPPALSLSLYPFSIIDVRVCFVKAIS